MSADWITYTREARLRPRAFKASGGVAGDINHMLDRTLLFLVLAVCFTHTAAQADTDSKTDRHAWTVHAFRCPCSTPNWMSRGKTTAVNPI